MGELGFEHSYLSSLSSTILDYPPPRVPLVLVSAAHLVTGRRPSLLRGLSSRSAHLCQGGIAACVHSTSRLSAGVARDARVNCLSAALHPSLPAVEKRSYLLLIPKSVAPAETVTPSLVLDFLEHGEPEVLGQRR